MALSAATIAAINNRHGATEIAQMTRGSSYQALDTYDADRLEAAHDHAMEWVKHRIGTQDVTHPTVIEAVPIFLQPPGADIASLEEAWERRWGNIPAKSGSASTTAVDSDDANSRRRYTGDDYENDTPAQSRSRPGRSSW